MLCKSELKSGYIRGILFFKRPKMCGLWKHLSTIKESIYKLLTNSLHINRGDTTEIYNEMIGLFLHVPLKRR